MLDKCRGKHMYSVWSNESTGEGGYEVEHASFSSLVVVLTVGPRNAEMVRMG